MEKINGMSYRRYKEIWEEYLTIKGGEPFADPNNIKILEKVAKTNPKCRIEICTNFQLVTDKVIELLYKIDEVHVQASIDGIYKLYNG